MPIAEDLESFFEEDDVGVLNGILPEIHAIFSNDFVDTLGQSASEPTANCITAELERRHAKINDTLRIDEDDYRIVGFEPDGTGMTVVRLISIRANK